MTVVDHKVFKKIILPDRITKCSNTLKPPEKGLSIINI